ncbi:MAG TPA: fatty acid desaturase [Solibacterales bacterium]|nr:fatty acid desaturase [Bryobacterales bacterium]
MRNTALADFTSDESFAVEDRQTRGLVVGLNQPRPSIFWTDMLGSAVAGWTAFGFAVALRPFSAGMLAALVVAVFALYRGLCFIHEISHLNPRALPGFERGFNLLFGYPLLMPSFVYVGVHTFHHRLSTYGTKDDPEYQPFARSSRMTLAFALQSFLIPVFLLVRFTLLTLAGLAIPKFQKWLVVRASSLAMNPAYRREAPPELVRSIRFQSILILSFWVAAAAVALAGGFLWRALWVWLVVAGIASFINTLRTLGAHAYESPGEPMDRQGQLIDSIDTPGAVWTELWAPVGLRYHALHHYFPGIPYHNLPEAYRRLVVALPENATYHQVRSRSLWCSLIKLYRHGLR